MLTIAVVKSLAGTSLAFMVLNSCKGNTHHGPRIPERERSNKLQATSCKRPEGALNLRLNSKWTD